MWSLGAISYSKIFPDKWLSACSAKHHRGSDDSDEWEGRIGQWNIAVAHQQLSILDLSSAGAQSMIHPVTGYPLVYSREIDNFVELKAKLEARIFRFRLLDFEYVLKEYERYCAQKPQEGECGARTFFK